MTNLHTCDLKAILHSKRANLYYLEHCRVLVNGGRVEYVSEQGADSLYWNIPIANTTCLLLGTGTSITQAAMRELAHAGVLVGFCGGGGTPLLAGIEIQPDVSWLSPQSEYRPTEYLQNWVAFWFHEEQRLQAAIHFQQVRIATIRRHWLNARWQQDEGFALDSRRLEAVLDRFAAQLPGCANSNEVLALEAGMTKALYKLAAQAVKLGEFSRAKNGSGVDQANRFLDHGNYLAYGLAATACWVIGLPHGLAILHGKTRRGGLVFDVADLVKDALILPNAFIAAKAGDNEQQFRQRAITALQQADALDLMIATLQQVALAQGSAACKSC